MTKSYLESGVTTELTQKEKSFLSILDKRWKWIVKDEDCIVCVFEEKPWKTNNGWGCNRKSDMFFADDFDPELTFNCISCDNEEPVFIEDLLKEENDDKE